MSLEVEILNIEIMNLEFKGQELIHHLKDKCKVERSVVMRSRLT